MRITPLIGSLLALATASLAACVSGSGEQPPMPKLAEDRSQPALALFEHVLTGHFAALGANAPTTCAALSPEPLTDRQEQALITRFVRLAPAARCVAQQGQVADSITGATATLIQVYGFACASEVQCAGWVARSGAPATRYAMRFDDGSWRFVSDLRIIAE
jgi:hypothetical protein